MDLIANINTQLSLQNSGYVAGSNDDIVTINGQAADRGIYIFDAANLQLHQVVYSLKNGHYMARNLDPAKQYLIMCRDYKKEYEPAVWDYVTPATDLTIAQQQELWQSWQTSP